MLRINLDSFSVRLSAPLILVGLAMLPAICQASDDGSGINLALSPIGDQHRGWDRDRSTDQDPFSVENRKRVPWFATAGAYFPGANVPVLNHDGGASTVAGQVGTDFSFGYRFPFEGGEGRLAIRGSEFNYGSDNFGFGNSRNASISEFDADILGRVKGLYAGVGVAFMQATLSSDFFSVTDNNTQTALAFTVGYDFTPRFFLEARGHYTGIAVYDGSSVSLGYRF